MDDLIRLLKELRELPDNTVITKELLISMIDKAYNKYVEED